MATHSDVLAWEIPFTEEPGRPESLELQRHNLATQQHTPMQNKKFLFFVVFFFLKKEWNSGGP